MKKIISGILICTVILGATGCTGPFVLTKKLHQWQTGFDDKWVDEVAFLGCVILPVYGLASLGDAIIFNSVEFWTGDNPMDSASLSQGDENIKLTHQSDGSILIESSDGAYILEKSDDHVCVKDGSGNVLYTAKTGTDNRVRVYNKDGKILRTFIKS